MSATVEARGVRRMYETGRVRTSSVRRHRDETAGAIAEVAPDADLAAVNLDVPLQEQLDLVEHTSAATRS